MVGKIGFYFRSFLLALAVSHAQAAPMKLKLGHALPPTHPVHVALEKMAELAKAKSGGELDISISHSGLLGNERELIQKVQRGFVAMTKTSTSLLESFVPEYATLSLPYLFRDEAHRWRTLDGSVGQDFLKLGIDKGLRGLSYMDAGTRSFYLRGKPVANANDLKGLKIRIQNSETMKRIILKLGAFPTPMGFDELYTSLGAGVVDGAENNVPSVFDARHYEVAKFYSLDEHSATPDMVLVSEQVWKRLSPKQQEALQAAALEAAQFQRDLWKKAWNKNLQDMQAKGLKVNQVDKASFVSATQSIYEELKGSANPVDRKVASLAQQIRDIK